MYHDDHNPPHFHVEYQGHEALVDINTGNLIEGSLPTKAERMVNEWCQDHRSELLANWARAKALEPLAKIAGADND